MRKLIESLAALTCLLLALLACGQNRDWNSPSQLEIDVNSVSEIEQHEVPLPSGRNGYVYRCEWPVSCLRVAKAICTKLLAPEFEIVSIMGVTPEIAAARPHTSRRAGCALGAGLTRSPLQGAICQDSVTRDEQRDQETRQAIANAAAAGEREVIFVCNEPPKSKDVASAVLEPEAWVPNPRLGY